MARKRRSQATASPNVQAVVEKALKDAGITSTQTKGSWCLKEGLVHVCSVHDGNLLPLVQRHGPPSYYHHCRHEPQNSPTDNLKAPTNSFQSLCRIVAGQQLAGPAAQAVWKRLLETTQDALTPATILELRDEDLVGCLKEPAGLSLAKANFIVDLSEHFVRGDLSDEFLQTSSESVVKEALLQVKGLGPWSCDMFLMFFLERTNVLPLGDLGIRRGLAKHFALGGSAKHGALCPKKDFELIQNNVKPFEPYQSLLSFYMWKAADTADAFGTSPKRTLPAAAKKTRPSPA